MFFGKEGNKSLFNQGNLFSFGVGQQDKNNIKINDDNNSKENNSSLFSNSLFGNIINNNNNNNMEKTSLFGDSKGFELFKGTNDTFKQNK